MKAILNSKFQKHVVTVIEYSSSDEDIHVVDEEYHIVDQTLEDIQEELRHTQDFPEEACTYKGKHKVSKIEIGTCSKPSAIAELNEQEDPAHQKVMESLLEVEDMKNYHNILRIKMDI